MKRFMISKQGNGSLRGRGGGASGHGNSQPATDHDEAQTKGATGVHAASIGATNEADSLHTTTNQAATAREGTNQIAGSHASASRATVVEEARPEVEDLPPPNSEKIELIPDSLWFNHHQVATGVAESFKAHYNEPYMNWTEVPLSMRDRWFTEFKRKFTWKPEYDAKAKRDYEKKGLERLKDHVNKAAKVPPHKQVSWMSNLVRAVFIRKRKDPKFLQRSEKAKKNRYSNQTIGSFDPGHRQGSISTIEVTERLAAKNGVLPSAADVYEKTHGVEMVDGENLLIGTRAKKTMADYKEKLDEYKDKGVVKAPNEVYLEVVGGQKKGKVYGLGSATSLFYKTPTSSQSTESSQVPSSLISQIFAELEDCKKMAAQSLKIAQAYQEVYEKEKAIWIKERELNREKLDKLQKLALEMAQMLKNQSCKPIVTPNTPRDPRDPTGGGAPLFA